MRLEIVVPAGAFISANGRLHWAEKGRHIKHLRVLAASAARHYEPVPTPCLVSLVIHRPKGGRLRDADNAQPTWKAMIDGFTDAGLWPDDSREYVVGPHARIAPMNRAGQYYLFEFDFTPMEVPF